jgi:hypothetical protein
MIRLRIKGGLGNQMFQFAAAYALSVEKETTLCLDLSLLKPRKKNITPRRYELDYFDLDRFHTCKKQNYFLKRLIFLTLRKLKSAIGFFPFKTRIGFYTDDLFVYDPDFHSLKPEVILEGFFQSPKYFFNYQNEVRRLFRPNRFLAELLEPSLIRLKEHEVTVSIHVRRGDYLKPDIQAIFGIISLDYYKRSIQVILEKYPNAHFFLFSDDLEWTAKEIGALCRHSIVTHSGPKAGILDMLLMSHCDHHIIANSSFSWWGAFLNPNKEKIVIAPSNWMNVSNSNSSDLIPENWIQL